MVRRIKVSSGNLNGKMMESSCMMNIQDVSKQEGSGRDGTGIAIYSVGEEKIPKEHLYQLMEKEEDITEETNFF